MRRNRRIILEGNHAVEYAIGYEDARDGLPQNSNDPWYSAGYADFLDGVHDQYEALHQDGITTPPPQPYNQVREGTMKISKRKLKTIIREEYSKLLKETYMWDNENLTAMAEEAGVYYKDWYDVPGICEAALDAGLMNLAIVDDAAAELRAAGVNSVEDAINHPNPQRLVDGWAVSEVDNAVAEYRRGKWPMHPNRKFAHSSYIPMLAWIISR